MRAMTERISRYPDKIVMMNGFTLVSTDAMIREGGAEFLSHPLADEDATFIAIDPTRDDKFSRQYQSVKDKALATLRDSTEAKALLALPSWSKEDRMKWEALASNAISNAMAADPLLGKYRAAYQEGITALGDLNKLTKDKEFDCNSMAVVESRLITDIEKETLPAFSRDKANSGDYRMQGQYYVATGLVSTSGVKAAAHGWVVSAMTGSVIEATHSPGKERTISSYLRPLNEKYTFDHFVAGYPIMTQPMIVKDGKLTAQFPSDSPHHIDRVYSYNPGFAGDAADTELVKRRMGIISEGEFGSLGNYTAGDKVGTLHSRFLSVAGVPNMNSKAIGDFDSIRLGSYAATAPAAKDRIREAVAIADQHMGGPLLANMRYAAMKPDFTLADFPAGLQLSLNAKLRFVENAKGMDLEGFKRMTQLIVDRPDIGSLGLGLRDGNVEISPYCNIKGENMKSVISPDCTPSKDDPRAPDRPIRG